MQLSDFNFELPEEYIAQYPLPERTHSRLLCVAPQQGRFSHHIFKDIVDLLHPGDLLIVNNTRVLPARLYGKKSTGGQVEILLERIMHDNQAMVMIKASKSLQKDAQIIINSQLSLTILERIDDRFCVKFNYEGSVIEALQQFGHLPLPPYIKRDDNAEDQERYQTVFSQSAGAIAAPTAGLHFDEALLKQIRDRGVAIEEITLHVGSGTFAPVRVDDITQHKMHKEYIDVSAHVCDAILQTKERRGRVIAVGTTVVRSLETAASNGKIQPFAGDTDIFIYPGFQFHCVDALITNFHLPQSTLLMLVAAFAGYETMMAAYQLAIREKYRFFSYGDAMFIVNRAN
ncbi:MAG: tRNA preQ1(34) S-adenosylmethionine ribosyltransferase-isomerase QueA [Legionellales bacterium]|nr:tRNA preQ1(34) S-adenosylmethionine ribosyltransferase-isomerase QueA [Legionellales bacterium]